MRIMPLKLAVFTNDLGSTIVGHIHRAEVLLFRSDLVKIAVYKN